MASSDPAPLITVNITSANGSYYCKALPDSGADISAAGKEILVHLNEHINTLAPSNVMPKAVNPKAAAHVAADLQCWSL